jgi:hypothetical protein
MFILYCFILLLLVYIVPALAVYPALLRSSRMIVAIPFVSIAVVVVIKLLLVQMGLWSHPSVLGVSVVLLIAAVVRVALLKRRNLLERVNWPSTHCYLLALCALFGIYWAAQLGTTGFDTDDEIYSWHMWAVQHYLGQEIDFYYTRSPYPQLFPILISYCYQLLGNMELQLPVKALFALFPVALWGAIAVAPEKASFGNAIRSIAVMILLTGAIGRYFSSGLADPLMAASLTVSIYLYIRYTRTPDRWELLILSLVCAAVALHTKQAALIWALFSFPLITLIAVMRRQLPPLALAGALALLVVGAAWVVGSGSGFQQNHGVINASQQGREIFEQLIFAVSLHVSDHPLTVIFLGLATASVFTARKHRDIWLIFLVPASLAWLIYGAYSLRLGIHLASLSALLITSNAFRLPRVFQIGMIGRNEHRIQRQATTVTVLIIILVIGASIYRVNRNIGKYGGEFYPLAGGRNTITKYFGPDSEFVFENLYDRDDLLMWVPSNYIYGIFYGHTPMIRPSPESGSESNYGPASLLVEIMDRRPDFLFDSGDRVAWGPGAEVLRELAERKCPQLFEKVAGPENRFGYVTYHLNNKDEEIRRCRDAL